ncbi:GNAT family N-acetyltransferase [Ancylobacter defluvii]|uniref:GNAT family N-acetyltransferase n=1 Tax=Ancylobacter defluvii TaxID=1282440 RepID=A0A9W6K1S1_9HYPH|nr:GNAT family N-acetyltransferase [Ancylobacter defluvii]MBS7587070.1 GNAT family N-acetyltransferase [Ancylobacter defluvii]GLK85373.1 GNAT family N-acetyltransferase [Ancylobacter defluvii]
MNPHPLDRPVWTALTSLQAPLAEGGVLARRYPADIVPFAAMADDRAESRRALAALVAPGETVVLAEAESVVLPQELSAVSVAEAVQMIAATPPAAVDDPRIRPLTAADAAEMLELATLTRPGPFSLKALSLGRFWGIRIDGRLAAMAGERMRQPGFTELSGVCAHPERRGHGLGRTLSLHVAAQIVARGDTPYLHAYAGNGAAIGLYESIGFRLRRQMKVVVASRAA